MCRTSPSRYSPVTSGRGPPYAAASAVAISPTVCGSPLATLYAAKPGPGPADSASRFARATSRTWTKSRRWWPSSNTWGARPADSAERKIAATPAYGVSRGIRGP